MLKPHVSGPIKVFNEANNKDKMSVDCHCPTNLLVDDEPYNLIALEGLLMLLGFKRQDKAYNGADAIQKIRGNIAMVSP
jgi:hypothetical protein